ncbi:MAG: UDP-N-acetylmuramate--L-alanine ligase [Chloroflexi bacterium]|nr:UDP-N-acetylmuramate--L-alanine ligase [Chloroflexota bacterium]|tara:strand:+ start:655 stop:2088 length:1434 start_codon:yes stop_codon:yes gene_type:complete
MRGLKKEFQPKEDLSLPQHIHLVGAGGVHMSAIGQILIAKGHILSGSDLSISDYTKKLSTLGAEIFLGHNRNNIGQAELLVTTAAVKNDNPELIAAKEKSIPIMLRAEMVQILTSEYELIAIAGSHGKTTTTGLIALILEKGKLDPLVLLGGNSPDLGGNLRIGSGKYAVVEADEYAKAFLQYRAKIALITNIEIDHLDYYKSEKNLYNAFDQFAEQVISSGLLVISIDSPLASKLKKNYESSGRAVETYSIEKNDAIWSARNLRPNEFGGLTSNIFLEGRYLGEISLPIPGRHNMSNAVGALAVAMRAGVDFNRAASAIQNFSGITRHFEIIGEPLVHKKTITIIDDYAHHPTEVRATVSAVKQKYGKRRLVACFQPHTFSRSEYLLEQWRHCFETIDELFILSTYPARETPDAGIDAKQLSSEISSPQPINLESLDIAAKKIAAKLEPGDIFLTLGAGDITNLGPAVMELLEATK